MARRVSHERTEDYQRSRSLPRTPQRSIEGLGEKTREAVDKGELGSIGERSKGIRGTKSTVEAPEAETTPTETEAPAPTKAVAEKVKGLPTSGGQPGIPSIQTAPEKPPAGAIKDLPQFQKCCQEEVSNLVCKYSWFAVKV